VSCTHIACLTAGTRYVERVGLHIMGFARVDVRVWAVISMAAYTHSLALAVAHFNEKCNSKLPPKEQIAAPAAFIKYNYSKFMATGAVADRHRSGRKHKVPKHIIETCIEAVKTGITVWNPIISMAVHR
jgi:hypothetical protein